MKQLLFVMACRATIIREIEGIKRHLCGEFFAFFPSNTHSEAHTIVLFNVSSAPIIRSECSTNYRRAENCGAFHFTCRWFTKDNGQT